MAEFPSLPLFTDSLLGDTQHLNDAEFGSYMLLLIVSWRSSTCDLPDDDAKLARICRCSLKVWRAGRRSVMVDFFSIEGGRWRQKKLLKVRAHVTEVSGKRAKAAAKRYESTSLGAGDLPDPAAGVPDTNPLNQAKTVPAIAGANDVAHASLSKSKDFTYTENKRERGADAPAAPSVQELPKAERKPDPAGKGCRIPAGFEPDLEVAIAKGLTVPQAQAEAEKFVNFWQAKPGKDGVKADWAATWRNWCIKAAEYAAQHAPRRVVGGYTPTPPHLRGLPG